MKRKLLFGFILFVFFFSRSYAYITHNGGNASGTWTAGATHYVISTVTIPDNQTLTIEAGCVIKFASGAKLYVIGTLTALGAPGSVIVFTSANDTTCGELIAGANGNPLPGDWEGIHLYGSYSYDYEGTGNFEYCSIRYGGYTGSAHKSSVYFYSAKGGSIKNSVIEKSGYYGVHITMSYPTIRKDSIRNCVHHGLYAHDSNTNPSIDSNVFLNNGQYGAYLTGVSLQSYAGNYGSGNGINGFGVAGTVDGAKTWRMGSNTFPFVVTAQVNVSDNYSLTLAPGTIIKFDTQQQLYVNGTLNAYGTADSTIVFTSLKDDLYGGNTDGNNGEPSPGIWSGIQLTGSYTYDWEGTGNFEYCRIRYGGYTSSAYKANVYFNTAKAGGFKYGWCELSGYYGIHITGSYPSIVNDTIRNSGYHGLYVHDANTNPTIANNVFLNNAQYAAYLTGVSLQSYSGNTGSGNGINGFGVAGSVDANKTWRMGSALFPFVITAQVNINDNDTLTLPPGTVIKFASQVQLYVNGTLKAVGTADSNIVFTSLKDDAYGGNTDGENGAASPGDWYGIQLSGNYTYVWEGTGEMDYCRVRFGGSTSSGYKANIFFTSSIRGHFRNSVSEFSGYYGIHITNSYPTISYDTVRNCGYHGIYVRDAYTTPTIIYNTFLNNLQYGVYISGAPLQSYYGNSGSGNLINGFGVSGSIESDISWSMGGVDFPFVATSQINVNDNRTLTVAPGTIIKFTNGTQLYVNGTLKALGTADSNIVFTSFKDDAYGGNTDGDHGNPAPGDWYGVNLTGSYSYDYEGHGEMDYCRLRYGGNAATGYRSNLYFNQAKGGHFTHGNIEYSGYDGIYIYLSYPTIQYNTIANSARHGIYIESNNTNPTVKDNSFLNNASYGAYISTNDLQDYTGNSGSGNGNNSIGVMGTVTQNRTWSTAAQTFSISLMGTVTINTGAALLFNRGMLNCGTNYLAGAGHYTLDSGAALGIGSPDGIAGSGSSGNIRNTGNRNFSAYGIYVYQGTVAQNSGSGLPSPLYGTLELRNNNGMTLQKQVTMYGSCVLTNGNLNLGGYALNVSGMIRCGSNLLTGSGSFVLYDGATLSSGSLDGISASGGTGNIQNSGTRTFSTAAAYKYEGVIGQVTGNGLPSPVSKLYINNPSGITLTNSVTIADTLFLQSGLLSTGTQTLTIGTGQLAAGAVVQDQGRVAGNIKRWISGAKTGVAEFPLGTAAALRNVDVSFTTAPVTGGSITASFNEANPGTDGLPLNDEGVSIGNCGTNGYWTLTSGDGLSGGIYALDITGQSFGGVKNPATLRILKRQSGGSWTLDGTHQTGTGSISLPIVHRSGLAGFSEFGIGGGADNPLGTKLLNLTVLLQGFYNSGTNTTIPDTLAVYLRNAVPPYAVVDSARCKPNTAGIAAVNFESASNEVYYYLVIKHRNSIETWSAAGSKFSAYQMSYNFTDAANKAFGDNLTLKGERWCIFGADCNQDGIVDYSDLALVDNDQYNFVSGYVVTDCTGDDFVDYSDLSLCDNNSYNFVSAVTPSKKKSTEKTERQGIIHPKAD